MARTSPLGSGIRRYRRLGTGKDSTAAALRETVFPAGVTLGKQK
jgi:hypothetical protein